MNLNRTLFNGGAQKNEVERAQPGVGLRALAGEDSPAKGSCLLKRDDGVLIFDPVIVGEEIETWDGGGRYRISLR